MNLLPTLEPRQRRSTSRRRVRGEVVRANGAGLVLNVESGRGFLPVWELGSSASVPLDHLVGKTMRLHVIGTTSTHVVLSELSDRARRRRARHAVAA